MRHFAYIFLLCTICGRSLAQSCNSPVTEDVVVCAGESAVLMASSDPGEIQWFDQPSGGNQLAVGSRFVTPPINSTITYYVQLVDGDCTSSRTSVTVRLRAGPNAGSASVCAGSSVRLNVSGPGREFQWFSSPASEEVLHTGTFFDTPPLNESVSYYVRQVFPDGCISPRSEARVNVIQKPDPPIVPDMTVCSGASPTLSASGPGGLYQWFSSPSGGNPIITSPDFTTPPLSSSAVYYVQTNVSGCVSDRVPVRITVNPIPPLAEVAPQTICAGSSAILTASGPEGATYSWYEVPSRGDIVGSGTSFSTPPLDRTTTYYVVTNLNGCSSSRRAVTVIVNDVPEPPVSPSSTVCAGSTITLNASGRVGAEFYWYAEETGGEPIGSGSRFITPVVNTSVTYYVEQILNSCVSSRTPVRLTVSSPPSAPRSNDVSICSGNVASLTVLDTAGIFEWYSSASGGEPLFSGITFTTPVLYADTIYYVQALNANCASSRVPVAVRVIPAPAPPRAANRLVCPGQPATLSVEEPSGLLEWFDVPEGGTVLHRGAEFTTLPISESRTFYVQRIEGDCISSRTPVAVQLRAPAEPAFRYTSGTYCRSSANPRPVILDRAGGTFSAQPAGLVFVNASTGEIDIAASANGSYTITFTSNGPCAFTSSRPLRITDSPNPVFRIDGPYCQGGENPEILYPTGGSGGVFSVAPAGLVFTSENTIDLSASSPGVYTITNTIPSNGSSCPSVSASDTVLILPAPSANAGPDQIAFPGTVITLNGSASGYKSLSWSGGGGTFSAPDSASTLYTPAPGETNVTLRLRAYADSLCSSSEDIVMISYRLDPPFVSPVSVCRGQSAILTASGQADGYRWYDATNGGNLLFTGDIFETPPLANARSYYVEAYAGQNTSPRTRVDVNIIDTPPAPIAFGASICSGTSATLKIENSGSNYQWFSSETGGEVLGTAVEFNTPVLTANTTFYVQSVSGSCASARTAVNVVVNAVPRVSSRALEVICNRSALAYQITADQPGANFIWSRDAVPGISNAAVEGQTTSFINEILISTSDQPVKVTYLITPYLNGCAGPDFRYVVTVDPSSVVTSPNSGSICNNSASNYQVTFNLPGTSFSWSRQAVPGISNAGISGQRSAVIREILTNTTNAPIDVTYRIDHSFEGCQGIPFDYVVRVNPLPRITSRAASTICSGETHQYQITSNVAGTTFLWSRAARTNIANEAVTGQTGALINETLVNTGSSAVTVVYTIIPTANGCEGAPFEYRLTVNPTPNNPVINARTEVCLGSSINLGTPQVQGATYLWTGPNGWSSTQRNNILPNVTKQQEGSYGLVITLNGCISDRATVNIRVNEPPTVFAGSDQTACGQIPEVQLSGSIGGGATRGVWSSSGSGTFLPSSSSLNARYVPSATDRSFGSITLTLTSASADDCVPASSSLRIVLEPVPVVNAGADQSVCSQDPLVNLSGIVSITDQGIWTTSGNGSFSPSSSSLNAVYIPSSADIIRGRVILTLTATGANTCLPVSDQIVVNIIPPPQVDIGPDILLPLNRTITVDPKVSYSDVEFLWSPNSFLNSSLIRNPVITGVEDITYTLRVTDSRGCVTEDQVFVDVLMPIFIPNTFTPNGDGVNDVWNIRELITYPGNTVQVFNRYGERVFGSTGYQTPWDGSHNGQPAPVGTYYYIINTQFPGMVYSGYITLIR